MAKKDLQVSDVGSFIYPHLTTPDMKYKMAFGEYHVKVNMPASEKALALKEAVDTVAAAALVEMKEKYAGKKVEKGSKPPKIKLCDDMPYREEEDGTITFSFKSNAGGLDKDKKPWTRKPALFDSHGVPIKREIKIGGGTVGKVAFEISPWNESQTGAGAKLRLYSVQILKLVEWGTRDAAGYGFEAEEDGFSVNDLEADNEFTATDAESGDDGFAADAATPVDASAKDEF